jgi:SNF2 family DNA or RNA helicase
LRRFARACSRSDVFDLPPKLYTRLDFDLSPVQRRLYDQMQQQGFTLLGERQASAQLALTVLLRLQQICCGYLVTDPEQGEDDPLVMPILPNPRLDLLEEVVQGVEPPRHHLGALQQRHQRHH